MEIILTPRCKSFTGTISRYHGYAIRQSGKRFFSYRTPGKYARPDGHWQFIVSCAELAKHGFMLSDIQVSREEVRRALLEAGDLSAVWNLNLEIYNARDILNLKTTFGL